MTTVQIVILSALFIFYLWSACYRLFKYDNERNNTMFELILFSVTMILLLASVLELNQYRNTLKCPEYEKVENVYRLKQ